IFVNHCVPTLPEGAFLAGGREQRILVRGWREAAANRSKRKEQKHEKESRLLPRWVPCVRQCRTVGARGPGQESIRCRGRASLYGQGPSLGSGKARHQVRPGALPG